MGQKCATMVDGWAESQVEMGPLWNWPHGEAGMMCHINTIRLSYVKQQETQESVLLGLPVNYIHYIMIFLCTYYVIRLLYYYGQSKVYHKDVLFLHKN